jgi:lysyl-tRNA synthetase, class II
MAEKSNLTRIDKIDLLRQAGINPYPVKVDITRTLSEYRQFHNPTTQADTKYETDESVAGRVTSIRNFGKLGFVDIKEGNEILQLYLRGDTLGSENYDLFFKTIDRGDLIHTRGTPCRTQKGELSLLVDQWGVMCKSVREIPFGKVEKSTGERRHTLRDLEVLRRWPELKLQTDSTAYNAAIKRSKLIMAIRRFYDNHSFLEAPIPIVEREYGGAAARPFLTKVNAIGSKLPLRISHELTLKRLCVGGMEKVYHLGPAFRNEGIDADHHPEFLLCESYAFNYDYYDVMDLFEELVETVLIDVNGTSKARFGAHEMDFKRPWKRLTLIEALKEYANLDVMAMSDLQLKAAAIRCNKDVLRENEIDPELQDQILVDKVMERNLVSQINTSNGRIIGYLFEECVEKKLVQPTIIYDYPWETSPLCKRHRNPKLRDRFIERFEAFACSGIDSYLKPVGGELANAYTELNDPVDQRLRMEEQAKERAEGNEETFPQAEEFIRSIEYGLPPLGGLGFGVDRLAMIATGHLFPEHIPPKIQDIILFPIMSSLDEK